jgi:hypothetical protein
MSVSSETREGPVRPRLLSRPLAAVSTVALSLLLAAAGSAGLEVLPENPTPAVPNANGAKGKPSEKELLWKLCKYLRLSKSQVGLLLPTARYVERGRELHQRQVEQALRRLEKLADQPAEAARLKAEIDQAESRLASDVTTFAGPQLARILTREQIALIWRLEQGNPPKYANADPALVDPSNGFANNQAQLRGYLLELRGGLDRDGAERGAVELLRAAESLVVQQRELDLRSAPTRPAPGPLPESGAVRGAPGAFGRVFQLRQPTEKPFPQLVIETNDLKDLLPPLEPFARRVYLSDAWLETLQDAYSKGLGVSPSRNHLLVAQGPTRAVRDYRMERGLRDQTGFGPELEPLGGELDHGQYVFGPGQGLRMPDAGVRGDYQVEINFRWFGGEGYQKIIDFKHAKDDGGLYFYNGSLTFYTLANGPTVEPGQDHRVRLERNHLTHVVRAYLDLKPVFAFIDLDDAAVFDQGEGYLFVDDVTTRNEQGPGEVRWVNVRGPAAP